MRRALARRTSIAILTAAIASLGGCGPSPDGAGADAEGGEPGGATQPLLNATETVEGPWVFSLTTGGGYCTASVLSPHWVVTAVHCLEGVESGDRVKLSSTYAVSGTEGDIYDGPAEVFRHPGYAPVIGPDPHYDVALLRLDTAVALDEYATFYVDPDMRPGDRISVIGRGLGSPIGGTMSCADGELGTKRIGHYYLTQVETKMLGLDELDQEICPGDSGAPWVVWHAGAYRAAGIQSRYTGFGDHDAPRLRPKVDWFEEVSSGTSRPLACPTLRAEGQEYRVCYEPERRAVMMDSGGEHACAVLANDEMRCWGRGTEGQLMNGARVDQHRPTPTVDGLGPILGIATGLRHTCVIRDDPGTGMERSVFCSGDNTYGQLGADPAVYPTAASPLRVLERGGAFGDVYALTAGDHHTCAIRARSVDPDGALVDPETFCWGRNDHGQLGNETVEGSTRYPTRVGRLDTPVINTFRMESASEGSRLGLLRPIGTFEPEQDLVAIDAGAAHTCAVKLGGTVRCWGRNNHGQLGDGSTTDRDAPTTVLGLSGVTSLSAGAYHTCAVRGSIRPSGACWGYNVFGQLADGSTSNRTYPNVISLDLGNGIGVTAGLYHTCFYSRFGGGQRCAGYAGVGALGAGDLPSFYTADLVASEITGVTDAAAGSFFTCSLTERGAVQCTGYGSRGQLGQEDTGVRWTPHVVQGLNLD